MRSLSVLLVLAACGGGASVASDGGPPGADGMGPVVDANVRADARTDCPVPRTFVAPGAVNASATRDGQGIVTLELDLDAAGMPDRFQLRLVKGRGIFIDELTTGTFGINGAQLDNDSCAICAMVLADVSGGLPAEHYFAADGIVELDAVDGQVTGRLTDVGFRHVMLPPDPADDLVILDDGCVTRISSLAFDLAITGP